MFAEPEANGPDGLSFSRLAPENQQLQNQVSLKGNRNHDTVSHNKTPVLIIITSHVDMRRLTQALTKAAAGGLGEST
jgi:hypothetical protein